MQASDMGALRLLRSQTHLLNNLCKFKLLSSRTLILYHHPQNLHFSRHFGSHKWPRYRSHRPVPKSPRIDVGRENNEKPSTSSSHEPVPSQIPRIWSRADRIKVNGSYNGGGEVESRVNNKPNASYSGGGEVESRKNKTNSSHNGGGAAESRVNKPNASSSEGRGGENRVNKPNASHSGEGEVQSRVNTPILSDGEGRGDGNRLSKLIANYSDRGTAESSRIDGTRVKNESRSTSRSSEPVPSQNPRSCSSSNAAPIKAVASKSEGEEVKSRVNKAITSQNEGREVENRTIKQGGAVESPLIDVARADNEYPSTSSNARSWSSSNAASIKPITSHSEGEEVESRVNKPITSHSERGGAENGVNKPIVSHSEGVVVEHQTSKSNVSHSEGVPVESSVLENPSTSPSLESVASQNSRSWSSNAGPTKAVTSHSEGGEIKGWVKKPITSHSEGREVENRVIKPVTSCSEEVVESPPLEKPSTSATPEPVPRWSSSNATPVKPVMSHSGGRAVENGVNKPITSDIEGGVVKNRVNKPNMSYNEGATVDDRAKKPITSYSERGAMKSWTNSTSNLSNVGVTRNFVGKGKTGKNKTVYVCNDCGHSEGQWWGTCKACNKVGTMKQFSYSENVTGGKVSGAEVSENVMRSWLPEQKQDGPVRLADVNRGINYMEWRIRLYGPLGAEVARVLGGGVMPGSLILVGGDPGVGKSTLSLQIAALIAESCDGGAAAPVLYVSGEESVEQIGNRADRLNINTEELFLYSSTDVEDILENVQHLCPRAVIIDSIQTVYLKGVTGSPGGLMQVKECTSALLRYSKKTNVPVLLIGHVNKSGDIAGPRVLEHIVDVVLYMEGEKHSSHRLLRSVKNRFGSTDELGVFEMSESGMKAVTNPSEIFLSEEHSHSEHLAGLATAVIIDGSRSFLIEVQALCVTGVSAARHVNGVQANRADMIISVLKKQAGLKLEDNAIFLNVVSGFSLTETAGDLAVAAAICSSFLEFPIPNHVAFIGEIGLGGELRMIPRIEKRVNALAKLGYKKCVVPKSAKKALAALSSEEIEIVGCTNLKEVIGKVFRKS